MKKIVLFLACGLLIGSSLFAQTTLKLAYINSNVLLSAMPETAKADSELTKYAKSFQDQLELMVKEGQTKYQQFQAGEKTMTEVMKEVKMKEIQDLQARIQSIEQGAQEKVQTKRRDLYQPIQDKADKALKAVAKEKGYDFIFDIAAGGSLVFQKEEFDVTNLVKAKLGIK